jgi:hypothetical protein
VKTPLQDLTITGSAKTLSAIRGVLGDLLSVTNAPSAVLTEGPIPEGQFKVQASLATQETTVS